MHSDASTLISSQVEKLYGLGLKGYLGTEVVLTLKKNYNRFKIYCKWVDSYSFSSFCFIIGFLQSIKKVFLYTGNIWRIKWNL